MSHPTMAGDPVLSLDPDWIEVIRPPTALSGDLLLIEPSEETEDAGGPADRINFAVQFTADDEFLVGGVDIRPAIEAAMLEAGSRWAPILNVVAEEPATVEIVVDNAEFDDPRIISRAGFMNLVASDPPARAPIVMNDGTVEERDLALAQTIWEMETGVDPNGNEPDILVMVSDDTLERMFGDVPGDQRIDAVGIFTHELGHGLGILSTVAATQVASTWDQQTGIDEDGGFTFVGPEAMETFGGPVPLAGRSHFDTDGDLMFPYYTLGTISPAVSALDNAAILDISVFDM